MRPLQVVDLGRTRYTDALREQHNVVAARKQGRGADTLFFVEHPHVITLGRNAREKNVLASPEVLARTGIEVHESNRGGDVTYHGPGQLVGYPILDLREWRRDVRLYFRGIEQCLIDALQQFGIPAERKPEQGYEGVWVNGAKIAAIGVHISRWITSHGFALNVDTNLKYFQYIVPCGLTEPVCSLRSIGSSITREQAQRTIVASFTRIFGYEIEFAEQELQETR